MAMLLFLAAQFAMVTGTPEYRQYKEKDVVQVDSTKAYIVIRSDYPMGIELFRAIEPADRAFWESERLAAFTKAQKKYQRDLKNYERDIRDWDGGNINDRKMMGRKPARPPEITLETVAMVPIELANFVTVARKPLIAEDSSGLRTYLVQVQPGAYTLTGAASMFGGIGTGNCFCMGTLGFVVRPGQIVDVGTIRGSAKDYFASPTFTAASARPASIPQLAGRTIGPAAMVPVGKIANVRAVPVTRISPIAGVLAYERDIPLDVAKGNWPIPAVR